MEADCGGAGLANEAGDSNEAGDYGDSVRGRVTAEVGGAVSGGDGVATRA
jgi:hypothetical protein